MSKSTSTSSADKKRIGKDGTYDAKYLKSLDRDQLIELKASSKGKALLIGSVDMELSRRLSACEPGNTDFEQIKIGKMRFRDGLKQWHHRTFVLTPEKLFYYKQTDPVSGKTKPDGYVELSGCSVSSRDSKKEENCFKIAHPTAKAHHGSMRNFDYLILACESEEEKSLWMAAIETSILFCTSGGTANTAEANGDGADTIESSSDDDQAVNVSSKKSKKGKSKTAATASDASALADAADGDNDDDEEESTTTRATSSGTSTPKKGKKKKSSTATASAASASEAGGGGGGGDEKQDESAAMAAAVASAEIMDGDKPVKPTTYEVAVPASVAVVKKGGTTEKMKAEYGSVAGAILRQLRPGVDLSRIPLPTFILEPRSMLEKLTDFMTHSELLLDVPTKTTPVERMLQLLKFYVSGFYIKPDGVKKPYNPIIGETFRCMWEHPDSHTHYIAEQVSHHPPISAFYIQNRKKGILINGSILFGSKFMGTYAASLLNGFASVHLLEHDEEYRIGFPDAHAKGFVLGPLEMELVGKVQLTCEKHNLSVDLNFKSKGMWFGGDYNVLKGEFKQGDEVLYTIEGKWDDELRLVDPNTKEKTVLWNPEGQLRMAMYKPVWDEQGDFESNKLWMKVTEAIECGDQKAAALHKGELEDDQRAVHKRMKETGEAWVPKLFFESETDKHHYKYKWMSVPAWDAGKEIDEVEADHRLFSVPPAAKAKLQTIVAATSTRRKKKRAQSTVPTDTSTSTSSSAAPAGSSLAQVASASALNNSGAKTSTKSTSGARSFSVGPSNATNAASTDGSVEANSEWARSVERRLSKLEVALASSNRGGGGGGSGSSALVDSRVLVLIIAVLYSMGCFNVLKSFIGY